MDGKPTKLYSMYVILAQNGRIFDNLGCIFASGCKNASVDSKFQQIYIYCISAGCENGNVPFGF